jgi:hypothetical protein
LTDELRRIAVKLRLRSYFGEDYVLMPYTETQPKPEPEPDPEPEPEPDPPILIGPDDNDQSKKRQNGELKELFKLYAPLL